MTIIECMFYNIAHPYHSHVQCIGRNIHVRTLRLCRYLRECVTRRSALRASWGVTICFAASIPPSGGWVVVHYIWHIRQESQSANNSWPLANFRPFFLNGQSKFQLGAFTLYKWLIKFMKNWKNGRPFQFSLWRAIRIPTTQTILAMLQICIKFPSWIWRNVLEWHYDAFWARFAYHCLTVLHSTRSNFEIWLANRVQSCSSSEG